MALFDATGSVFNPSGSTHSVGLVPDPGSTAGSLRFLCEDGTWVTPSGAGVEIEVGVTPVLNATDTYILYNDAGILGEYSLTGTGTVAVMQTSPDFLTSISYENGNFTTTALDIGTNYQLRQTIANNELNQWWWGRALTTDYIEGNRMLDISQTYDCLSASAAGGSRVVEINYLVGYTKMAGGSPGGLSVSMLVERCERPDVGVSEPFGHIMLTQANRTATDAYDCLYWGTDWTINGPVGADPAVRERYISGINMTGSKYCPGNEITTSPSDLHAGSCIASFSVTTFGGANSGDRVGFGLTAYPFKWGLVLTGYSGAVDTVANGHSVGATAGMEIGLQIGGQGGAWMADRPSKIDTNIYLLDHTELAIHISDRHPDDTGEAMWIEDTAGSVGIWSVPNPGPTQPLTIGKSYAGEQVVYLGNPNTGATSVAKYQAVSDSNVLFMLAASAAAGDYVSIGSQNASGGFLIDVQGASSLGVKTNGVDRWSTNSNGETYFFRDYTDPLTGEGTAVRVLMYHDADLGAVGTQGSVLSVGAYVGHNTPATGNSHSFATVQFVQDCVNPPGAFMEVACEFSYMGAQWLDTPGGSTPVAWTNGDIAYWGRDYTVVGPIIGQEAYLSSETHYVAKYYSVSTIDGFHMGTNGIAIATLPNSGPQFGSRAGQTSYPIDDGVVVTGFSGPVTGGPTDGNSANATIGFTYAFRAGGPNGAGWTHQKVYSQIGTGFGAFDYMNYGVHIVRRNPLGTGAALYVQDGAGTVGIWRVPPNDDTRPLTVGKSVNSDQILRVHNENSGASALATFEAVSEGAVGRFSAGSIAAGDSVTLLATGGSLYIDGPDIRFRISGTDEVYLTSTALYPFTNDGTALGSSTNAWSDLYLASGGTIVFNNDVTITVGSNVITITGGDLHVDPGGVTVYPIVAGTAGNQAQFIKAVNLNAGASAQAGFEAAADGCTVQLIANSIAAGDSGIVGCTGGSFYVAGDTNLILRISGTDEVQLTATALFPFTDGGSALGTTANMWANLYLSAGGEINFGNGDVVIDSSTNQLNFNGATLGYIFDNGMYISSADPFLTFIDTSTGSDCAINGSSATGSMNYFADFNNEVASSTHNWYIDNTGATLGMQLTPTALTPGVDGAQSLGTTALAWQNLYINAAGTINFDNSDVVITHSTNALTMSGGSLTVEAQIIISASDPFIRLTDTDTGADNSVQANNATGSLSYFADFNNEVSNSTHNWYIDNTGATLAMALTTTALLPGVTDGKALGSSSFYWSDLFLASGSVVDWAGDGTLTHSSNTLTWDGVAQVFNEAGADLDFRIEGDTQTSLFFADASTDFVGIRTSNVVGGLPLTSLHIGGNVIMEQVAGAANLQLRRFNGTAGTPTKIVSGNNIGAIQISGYQESTSAFATNQSIIWAATEDWTNTANGFQIVFGTIPNTSATINTRMVISNAGNTKIMTNSGLLAVRGTTEGTGHLDIFDGTDPVGTLASGISLYSSSGVFKVMDAAGAITNAAAAYTPTLTAVANVTGTPTPSGFRYIRQGNQVTVTGNITGFTTTVADTLTRIRISLPSGATSNFGAATDASGVAAHSQSVTTGYVIADAANNELEVNFFGRASTTSIAITAIYEII